MDFLHGIMDSYASFFNWETLQGVLSDPATWAVIGTLIILEGLLSADNALVLAVMVKHLPPEQRRKALFYGILGAYVFRFIAIGVGVYLIQYTWIQILGGAYLIWLSISHFIKMKKHKEAEDQDEDEEKALKRQGLLIRIFGNFWGTVVAVEMMDIVFSIDSVIAAFGISNQVWVLFLGGILGVLMMRGVAQIFLKLIDKVPEFETTAFVLIILIGIKMVAGAFGFHIEEFIFFSVIVLTFLGTFVVHKLRANQNKSEASNS
ncbi:TerC family protein [Bacillus massiliglaciei]|uniref:TerC family protein n=1 Tax=Bacillus massiliglaciei TaxID=1816693 RepID=UPI000A804704|nr:TerC family protein [Bacillus massiliglaciei]